MKYLIELSNNREKCHKNYKDRGKVFESPYDEEIAAAKFDAVDHIYAFMLSAIDRKYPHMKSGFRNSLPKPERECVIHFWQEYQELGYLIALKRTASKMRMPMEQLMLILNNVDSIIKSLANDQVREIMKAKGIVEIKFAMNFFWQKVQKYELGNLHSVG